MHHATPLDLICETCGAGFSVPVKTLKRKHCKPECAKRQGTRQRYFVTKEIFDEAKEKQPLSPVAFIAERLGCSKVTVCYQLRGLGLYCGDAGNGRSRTKNLDMVRQVDRDKIRPKGCLVCGEKRTTEAAHLVPRRAQGRGEIGNLVPMCPTHHKCYDRALLTVEEMTTLETKCREWMGDEFAARAVKMHGAAKRNAVDERECG